MHLPNGTLLKGGDYRIVRFINAGGFGNTYEGLDVNLNKRVAIKEFFVKDFCVRDADSTRVTVTVPGKKALIEYLKRKFVEEARAIANMEHENIVDVKALFEENGTAYYVMDFIDGESVLDVLKRRGSLPESEALPIIRKVASALGYMHSENRFHLDVKPSNIMLRKKDGKVVLIDFGSSKQYAEVEGENTTTMAPCYTPGYAAPEQMNSKTTRYSAATDIYALGATLYKMLTGLTPPSSVDLLSKEETLSPLPEEISKNVRECVTKAMILQRVDRMQRIDEFVALLTAERKKSGWKVWAGIAIVGVIVAICIRVANREAEEGVTTEKDTTAVVQEQEIQTKTFEANGVSFDMCFVEGGTFSMGSNDSEADYDEKPVHNVTLSSYYIGETEVTQALWQAVMGNNPSEFKGKGNPVENVSWDDCQDFVGKLNSLTGQTFRLPTEAEWEFAARGGNNTKGYKYSGSNNLDRVAWYSDNSGLQTHPVATKTANELGIHDMSGNVWEWCQDWKGSYSSSAQTNPLGPSSGSCRVKRGGGWCNLARDCRSSCCSSDGPTLRIFWLGLRLAL